MSSEGYVAYILKKFAHSRSGVPSHPQAPHLIMGRLVFAGTGTLLLLAKAHAVRLPAASSDRLVAAAPRKPGATQHTHAG